MNKSDWVWMPHAGHFICGYDCRFHLATFIPAPAGFAMAVSNWNDGEETTAQQRFPGVLISTVGEYVPDREIRRIHAEVRRVLIPGKGDAWDAGFFERFGFMEIGSGRTYETMVFPARRPDDEDTCCPYIAIHQGGERDMEGYTDAVAAFSGHLRMCETWAERIASTTIGVGL